MASASSIGPLVAPKRHLRVVPASAERVEPELRGERILRAGDGLFQRLDRLVSRALPEELNPLAQTGAIANTSFIIACVSGVLLLIWYSTSVHHAYSSIQAMAEAPFSSGLVRSIHRYSSDACMLFVLLHSAKLFFARRFGGSRWLAWVTGIFLIGTLWFVGWLGYWLVWDARAQEVALGTARMLDVLPIFADPLSRSFLTDSTVNSLLFFVVFFLHMLIPLLMGIALWLHITRLSRSRFLTRGWMTVWVVGATLALSLLFPADAAGPARMTVTPDRFSIDWWYLMPIALTDRLSSGALWAIALIGGGVLFSLPWLLAKGRARVAEVKSDRCNACEQCVKDCPYDAIRMVPREPAGRHALVAQVQASKCVGCGICAGSCNSAGIGLPWFDVHDKRRHVEQLVKAAIADGTPPMIAFACGESAGAQLTIDERSGACSELPGYRVIRVPCAGWVHSLSVERLLRRGAPGVLIVGCGPGSAMYREGPKWSELRMQAEREPMLRLNKVSPDRVRVLELFRHERRELLEEAERFRRRAEPRPRSRHGGLRIATGLGLAAALSLVTWGVTRIGYAAPGVDRTELVVSFKHPGQSAEKCREPTAEDKQKLPVHMRPKKVCERRRTDVRLRVHVDGQKAVERAYEPRGVWSDGNSIAIERIAVPEGEHDVRIEVGDTPDPTDWPHRIEQRLRFEPGHRRVVLFDKLSGFRVHD
jgi:quinol-cytochrome oxidoreductase complex cytochrome b subunit/coenzyme F420-reducing hydrogenase delta subunit